MKSSVIFLFAALALTSTSRAASPDAVPENMRDLADKFNSSKQKILEAETEKRRILGSLYTIDQRMKKISNDKGHLTDELFQAQDNVKNIAKVIASLELEIKQQRSQLRRRLRALYKLSGEGFIAVLFSQDSPQSVDQTLRFLKTVTENDYRLIHSYEENVAAYQAHKEKLKGQVEHLVAIEHKIKAQEGLLVSEYKSKSKIVSELDKQRVASLNQIKSLRDRTRGDDEVDELLKPSIFEKKGQLAPPIQGHVVQDFGLLPEDQYKIRLSHKGWRYAAPVGSSVMAIFDGRVAFSEWVAGYGHTVIIDHGDHYYTVYGHISRVRVKAGDTLKKGQVIAEAGGADSDHEPGLYFEIRHFSEPENPAAWIAEKELKISQVQ